MSKELDIEDLEFETLLADKRHKEIHGTLKSIAIALSNLPTDGGKDVVEAIKGQGEKIARLIKAIETMPKPDMPDVKVELNPKEFVSVVNKICNDIIQSNQKVIDALENRLLPDTFNLIKNYGVTQSVKVNYKSAKELKK